MMFETFYFEHPQDETHRVTVGAGGYLAAGLTGSLYVLWKAGKTGFMAAFVPHLLIMSALVATTGFTSLIVPSGQQLVILIVAIPAMLVFQSIYMIRVINQAYLDRGWIVHST
jgi:hypothetical protein